MWTRGANYSWNSRQNGERHKCLRHRAPPSSQSAAVWPKPHTRPSFGSCLTRSSSPTARRANPRGNPCSAMHLDPRVNPCIGASMLPFLKWSKHLGVSSFSIVCKCSKPWELDLATIGGACRAKKWPIGGCKEIEPHGISKF